MHHVDEALGCAVAPFEIAGDELPDHVGHIVARERRSDDPAERRTRRGFARPGLSLVSADLDLIPLLSVFIHAEDADVAYVVVAAGVHASRDVEVELAD